MAAPAAYPANRYALEAVLEDQVEAVLELVLEGPAAVLEGAKRARPPRGRARFGGVRLLVLERQDGQDGDQGHQDEPA